jgi:ribonucleoside-diphosphate reductase alpha subunit
MESMFVTKRNGIVESVHFDKITERISKLVKDDERKFVDPIMIAQKTVSSIYSGISTEELDLESAKICINLCTTHHLYSSIASRILVSNLHKKTNNTFVEKENYIQKELNLLDETWLKWVNENAESLNQMIDYTRDYIFDYFGFKTLERAYLIKVGTQIIETPQDMFMRVASFINKGDLDAIKKTYDLMSQGFYTHASPTLFNAANKRSQLSSCFLIGTDDSIEGITKTWADVSKISKWGGGIGLHVSNIRAKDSLIRGTNGPSSGIIPMLKVYNEIARYIDQGGKRKGSIAIYLEPHHADIMAFLDLRKNFGAETERARDLFTSMWISDLFMKQVQDDSDWYLMCPDICKGLSDVYGDEYEKLYWKYVNENKYKEKVKARDVMKAILDSQLETGTPYIAFKDSVNKKSNQKNIGTIKSSNLCVEILEYSDDKEYAVCNLASIAVNKFVEPFNFNDEDEWVIYSKEECKFCTHSKNLLNNKGIKFLEIKNKLPETCKTYPQIYRNDEHIGGYNELFDYIKGSFNYDKLYDTAYTATKNLDRIIDINFYPVIEAKLSNLRHRPIGLGIQGLADALVLLRIPFDSDQSIEFNKKMMETIYLAAITASNDISKERYDNLKKLYIPELEQIIPEFYDPNFVLKNNNEIYHKLKLNGFELNIIKNFSEEKEYIGAYSTFEGSPFSQGQFQFDLWSSDPINKDKWAILREEVKNYGVRNSLLTALMPTASTSQILGNNECFEFFTNNIYTRRTLAGDFPLVNRYLIDDLYDLNLWSNEMKQMIIANNGSIASFTNIPDKVKRLYQTIWEIKQIWVLKNAVARGPYVDQTQSMNIFLAIPDYQKLYSSHFWAWSNGLKTGIYYLRSKPAKEATKFTIDNTIMNKVKKMTEEHEVCENCSA